MTTEFKIIHQNIKSITRIGYDEKEAWFELQVIKLDADQSESKLKIVRFDWNVARAIHHFIDTKEPNMDSFQLHKFPEDLESI